MTTISKVNPVAKSNSNLKNRIHCIGRRKTSSARLWLVPNGAGLFVVNDHPIGNYFTRLYHKHLALLPFMTVDAVGKFDVMCTVKGGGLTGQAGAIGLALARALDKFNPNWHKILKDKSLLTRDARVKERKKTGLDSARKMGQRPKR